MAILLRHFLARPLGHEAVQRTLGRVEHWATLTAVGFVLYSGALYVNGVVGSGPLKEHAVEVVRIVESEVDLGVVAPVSWVELTSWRRPGGIERVLLHPGEDRTLWPGQRVLVSVRWGYFVIPWVVRIERDQEQYYRRIVEHVPTATRAWKELIGFYLHHQDWDKAVAATRRYLEIFPDDLEFAGTVADGLGVVQHPAQVRAVLEPVLDRRPDFMVYTLAGVAFSGTGEPARGVELLQAAIRLEPANYYAYYALGIVYVGLERLAEAAAMYEAALERNPNIPGVAASLAQLRKKLAQATPPGS